MGAGDVVREVRNSLAQRCGADHAGLDQRFCEPAVLRTPGHELGSHTVVRFEGTYPGAGPRGPELDEAILPARRKHGCRQADALPASWSRFMLRAVSLRGSLEAPEAARVR